MKLSQFIRANVDPIVADWEQFARSLPAGNAMTALALRDHCSEMLLVIADGMDLPTSSREHPAKFQSPDEPTRVACSPAAEHGALRQLAGFDLVQLFAEFRALRASVMLSWRHAAEGGDEVGDLGEFMLFSEGMDKALAESVQRYSGEVGASRDMFLAVLGHDLRGPLTGINMSTLLLAKPGLDEATRHKVVARIKRASTEMSGLITDLLEYTRTRLGAGMPIDLVTCELGPVCEDSVEAIRTGYPEQQFVQSLSGDLHLQADAPRLRQALSNLLSNAVQHGERGAPITLTALGTADSVSITVHNRGDPIAPDAIAAIFEPLVRAPNASARSHERSKTSLGLGLFIVREIVLGHGGSIEVRSNVEAGTVFTLRFPRCRDETGPSTARGTEVGIRS